MSGLPVHGGPWQYVIGHELKIVSLLTLLSEAMLP